MKTKSKNKEKTSSVPVPPKPTQLPTFNRDKLNNFKPNARFGTINRGRR